ncbi:MAG: hypothetical protein MK101_04635 [Phycisphaerales bacterium]|nr:hypothetical protein [Phycisphaerales bacterium]
MRYMLALIMCTWLLGACTASSPIAARIEVRDARSLAPIDSANVSVEGLTLFMPSWHEELGMSPGQTIGPTPRPPGWHATTDQTGQTSLLLAGNRPNAVVVHADGYEPLRLLVETSADSIPGPAMWRLQRPEPPGHRRRASGRLEARVTVEADTMGAVEAGSLNGAGPARGTR